MIRKGIVFLMFISTQDVDEGAAHVLLISHAETFTFPQPNIDLQKFANSTLFFMVLSGASLSICRAIVIDSNSHHWSDSHPWKGCYDLNSTCSFCQHLDPPFWVWNFSREKKQTKVAANFTSNTCRKSRNFPSPSRADKMISCKNLKMKFPAFCTRSVFYFQSLLSKTDFVRTRDFQKFWVCQFWHYRKPE